MIYHQYSRLENKIYSIYIPVFIYWFEYICIYIYIYTYIYIYINFRKQNIQKYYEFLFPIVKKIIPNHESLLFGIFLKIEFLYTYVYIYIYIY